MSYTQKNRAFPEPTRLAGMTGWESPPLPLNRKRILNLQPRDITAHISKLNRILPHLPHYNSGKFKMLLQILPILCKIISGAEVTKPTRFPFLLPTGTVKEPSEFPPAFPPEAQLKFTLKRELFCKSGFKVVVSVTQTPCLKSRELEGFRVQKS